MAAAKREIGVAAALANIAFAQNVKLKAGSDFTLMRNIDFGWTRPETRYAHGLTRTYGHGPPDAEITFTVSANAGAFAYLMGKSEGDGDSVTTAKSGGYGKPTRGVLSDSAWEMTMTGDGGGDEKLSFNGKLRDVNVRKPDGDNSEVVDLDCFVRITSDTVTVTLGGS